MDIHKINGKIGNSLSVVIPTKLLRELEMQKGDFVEIEKNDDKIVIKKLKV